jgi:hypothetical protein
MNDHEAQRIAEAIHALRPDWPTASLLTLIRKKLADKPRRDVAVALAWVACEPDTHTPVRVLEAGPWWRAVAVEGSPNARQPYDPATFCHICGGKVTGHRLTDHEPVSAAEYAARLRPVDVGRAVQGLRELKDGRG